MTRATYAATVTTSRGTVVHTIDVREVRPGYWLHGILDAEGWAATPVACARRAAQRIADATRGTVVDVREVVE